MCISKPNKSFKMPFLATSKAEKLSRLFNEIPNIRRSWIRVETAGALGVGFTSQLDEYDYYGLCGHLIGT